MEFHGVVVQLGYDSRFGTLRSGFKSLQPHLFLKNKLYLMLSEEKILDAVVLIIAFLIASVITINFQLTGIVAILLFYLPSSSYLLIKYPRIRKPALLFSVPAFVGFLLVDYVADYNLVWFIPTVFPFRIFELVSVEVLVWVVLWTLSIVTVYKVFIDVKHRTMKIRNYKWFAIVLFTAFVASFLAASVKPVTTYAYAKLISIPIIIPILYIVVKHPNLIPNLWKISLMMLFFSLVVELIGLSLNHWTFPGDYIGFIQISTLKIPFEEFILWIILGGACVASYYEIFVDLED